MFQLKLQVQRFKERTESALEEQAAFKYRKGKPESILHNVTLQHLCIKVGSWFSLVVPLLVFCFKSAL